MLKRKFFGPVLSIIPFETEEEAIKIVNETEYGLGNVVLISSDRDWDLLIQPGVMRFSYVTRKEITVDNWSDHYDVPQEKYADYKCLIGDKGDNIPGKPKNLYHIQQDCLSIEKSVIKFKKMYKGFNISLK